MGWGSHYCSRETNCYVVALDPTNSLMPKFYRLTCLVSIWLLQIQRLIANHHQIWFSSTTRFGTLSLPVLNLHSSLCMTFLRSKFAISFGSSLPKPEGEYNFYVSRNIKERFRVLNGSRCPSSNPNNIAFD